MRCKVEDDSVKEVEARVSRWRVHALINHGGHVSKRTSKGVWRVKKDYRSRKADKMEVVKAADLQGEAVLAYSNLQGAGQVGCYLNEASCGKGGLSYKETICEQA